MLRCERLILFFLCVCVCVCFFVVFVGWGVEIHFCFNREKLKISRVGR